MRQRFNVKERIVQHYDIASPYYRDLWGEHIHHGYYITGEESKPEAAENLIKQLVEKSGLRRGAKVLDVGCGIGGTAIYLAEHLGCAVTGVTISPVQVNMARKAAERISNKPSFLLADANDLAIEDEFDIIWAVEVINHLWDKEGFFRRCNALLRKGGKLCIAAWLKSGNLSRNQSHWIHLIEKGMLAELLTKDEFLERLRENAFTLEHYEDISEMVRRTWDVTSDMLKQKALWAIAFRKGAEFINFLNAFRAMKNGFETGAFRYALIVARS